MNRQDRLNLVYAIVLAGVILALLYVYYLIFFG